jgi:5-methyltetrahydrofolate--homocysteine methyltransferase
MVRFLEAIRSGQPMLMDAAMGTRLLAGCLGDGECVELLNLTQPDRVTAIHESDARAGARCFLTNTFQANPLSLDRLGHATSLEKVIQAGVGHARLAAGPDGFVLGDIGPFSPATQHADIWRVVRAFENVDGLLLETYSELKTLGVVMDCVSERVRPLPVVFSLTYRKSGSGFVETYAGHKPEDMARQAAQMGIACLGVNCGQELGMEEIIEVLKSYRQATDLPLLARPNAGTPKTTKTGLAFPRSAVEMAARVPDLVAAGATLIGGCCGTTAEFIAACANVL